MTRRVVLLVLMAIAIDSAAIASDTDIVIAAIMNAKPPDWQIHVDSDSHPPWSRSNQTCVELTLHGPALGGYTYFDSSGRKIAERKFINEAVTVWVTPKGFNSGWNPLTRMLNWFSPWATEFPE
jgi:hypothetical protein